MIGRPMLRADEKLDGIELKVIKILRIIFFLFDLLFDRIL